MFGIVTIITSDWVLWASFFITKLGSLVVLFYREQFHLDLKQKGPISFEAHQYQDHLVRNAQDLDFAAKNAEVWYQWSYYLQSTNPIRALLGFEVPWYQSYHPFNSHLRFFRPVYLQAYALLYDDWGFPYDAYTKSDPDSLIVFSLFYFYYN